MSDDWIRRAERLSLRVRDFIDGLWQSENPHRVLDKLSPRDGRLLYRLPRGGVAEADRAVAAARAAFEDGRWSCLPVQRRKEVLLRLAGLMDSRREELALLECLDVGKP